MDLLEPNMLQSVAETGKFPAQMASIAENVSIWWRLMNRDASRI